MNYKPVCNIYRFSTLSLFNSSYSFSLIPTRHKQYHSHSLLQTHPKLPYPDKRLHHLVQLCTKTPTIPTIQRLHALIITMGSYTKQPIFFNNNIISLYASLGEQSLARKTFDGMPKKNVVTYNSMIGACNREGDVDYAWKLFYEMWSCGLKPTEFTFGGLLSCGPLDIYRGFVVHAVILKNGLFDADAYAGTSLMGMLGRNGNVEEAFRLFEDMPEKSMVTWNSIISLLGSHGFLNKSISLFRDLLRSCHGFSGSTIVNLLSGIIRESNPQEMVLRLGEVLHCLVIKNRLDNEVSVLNTLLNMYLKCSGTEVAASMFAKIPVPDVVSYNIWIGALAKSERPEVALELLHDMLSNRVIPNQNTWVSLINCSARILDPIFGEYVHSKLIRNAGQHDASVGSALIDFYGKHGRLDDAHCCFDEIDEKNVVSWNSLAVSYSSKCSSSCVALLVNMLRLGYYPNEYTFSSVIKASMALETQQLHCLSKKMGLCQDEFILCSLVSSYAKNGLMFDALKFATSFKGSLSVYPTNSIAAVYNRIGQYDKSLEMLSTIEEPDTTSWNILISSCSHSGYHYDVFQLFRHMLMAQIHPDNYTIVSVLFACISLCCLALGRCIHALLIKQNFSCCDTFVYNMLIEMYGKCGSVEDSISVFNEVAQKDKGLITWTNIIFALGHHGYAHEALEKFKEMEQLGIEPDAVAFAAGLAACRHKGLVPEGMELFSRMKKGYVIEPDTDHYLGVVDLLASYGHLKEAQEVISSMPFPKNSRICRTFLEGCRRMRYKAIDGVTIYRRSLPPSLLSE